MRKMSTNDQKKVSLKKASATSLRIWASRMLASFSRGTTWFFMSIPEKTRVLNSGKLDEMLGVAQPDVSHLINGHSNRFTTDKLLDFFKRIGRKVSIQI